MILKKGTVLNEDAFETLREENILKATLKVEGYDYWIEQTLKKDKISNTEKAEVGNL